MTIEEIASNFLATLSGALIGILGALWVDRRTTKGHQKEKAIAILSSLKEEINHNLGLLKQMQSEFKLIGNSLMIYYNMDMNTWRKTSLQEFEGTISPDLLHKIFAIYYEYEHLSRKIDTQFNMNYSVVRAMPSYMTERGTIIRAIVDHASELEKESEQLVKEIDNELSKSNGNESKVDNKKDDKSEKEKTLKDNSKDDDKRENLRAVFLLGLLAVLVTIKIQYQNKELIVNLGQYPLDIIPLINFTIASWSFYAFFMVLGLSEDVIGKQTSKMLRNLSKIFLAYNFTMLTIFGALFFYLAFPSRLPLVVVLIIPFFAYAIYEGYKNHKIKPLKFDINEFGKKVISNFYLITVEIFLLCSTGIIYLPNEYEWLIVPLFIISLASTLIYIILNLRHKKLNK